MKVGYAVLYSNGILVISANSIKQFLFEQKVRL